VDGAAMRVRVIVAYDGTDYSGFQRQDNAVTVQEALEAALAQVSGLDRSAVAILAAGRTDAGVHALGQVVAFDTAWRHGLGDLHRALNAVLPADIAVLKVEETTSDFHPRYDARSRRYRYSIYNTSIRSPLERRYSLHVAAPLDVEAMQRAAQLLVGERDFATFGQPPQGDNTVRQVLEAEWGGETPRLHFDIEANGFLYRMVRSIVGTLFQVGRGERDVEAFEAALAARDRDQAGPTAPPQGLCLVKVRY
jgi:tRNA pseudouridine38-40 synthase